jgi:PKD repeat protein
VNTHNPDYSGVGGVLFDKSQATLIAFPGGNAATSYAIPGSVMTVGDYAFWDCFDLGNVVIPNSVASIGTEAFAYCGALTNIVIPASVTSIGSDAFLGCVGLDSVTIGSGITGIGSGAFADCESLTSVVIPSSVTSVTTEAFADCPSLSAAYFLGNAPAGDSTVFEFDTNATAYYLAGTKGWGTNFGGIPAVKLNGVLFTATPVTGAAPLTVNFTPAGVDSAGNRVTGWNWSFGDGATSTGQNPSYTYNNMGTYSVALLATNSLGATLLGSGPAVINVGPLQVSYTTNNGAITITGYTGSGGSVTIPSTVNGLPVTGIENGAFDNCQNVTSVTIPGSISQIAPWAFIDCTSLTNVTIANGVTSIGGFAFGNCTNLTSVIIPGTVTSIGEYAFYACLNLTNAVIGGKVATLADWAFAYCPSLAAVYFLGNPPSADSTVFEYDGSATAYYGPGSAGWGATFDGMPAVELTGRFSATPTYGVAPLTVSFAGATVDSVSNAIGGWNWTFGDGSTGTNQNPSHTYTNAGTFHPALVATNILGMAVLGSSPGAITTIKVPPAPAMGGASLSGANVAINGLNGLAGGTYHVLTSTNLTLPLSRWTRVATNVLSASGNFSITVTNTVNPKIPQRYYILESP